MSTRDALAFVAILLLVAVVAGRAAGALGLWPW
jgi:hypothetical protein